MRILYFPKDCPTLCSAYGKIAYYLAVKRLSKLNNPKSHHDVTLFCTVPQQLTVFTVDGGVEIYPGMSDMHGEDMFLEWYKQLNADVYLTQYDIWCLNKVPQAAARGEIVWIPWLYMDMEDFPDYMIQKIRPALRAIPTSKWLESELIKKGLSNITSPVSPGVDPEEYRPLLGETDSSGKLITKERLRAGLGFEADSFIVGMVQMNQLWRKPFPEQFEGIKIFQERNKDIKVRVFVHSQPKVRDAWDLPALAKYYGIDSMVRFAEPYELLKGTKGYSEDRMCKIYNGFDVLLEATGGESPGYPLIEAQACFPSDVKVTVQDLEDSFNRIFNGYLVDLETENGFRCNATPNHPFLTIEGWKSANLLREGDHIFVGFDNGHENMDGERIGTIAEQLSEKICQRIEPNNISQFSRGTVENERLETEENDRFESNDQTFTNFNGSGVGIHRRTNRRRRQHFYPAFTREQTIRSNSNIQFRQRRDGLASEKTPATKHVYRDTENKTKFIHEAALSLSHQRNVFPQIVPEIRIASYNKKKAHQNSASLDTKQNETIALQRLLRLRTGTPESSILVEHQTIEKIRRRKAENLRVYNLKVASGIYFANGILVHNCGIPCLGTDTTAIPEFIKAGYTVKVAKFVQSPNLIKKALPDPYDIADKLEKVARSGPQKWLVPARDFAKQFTWDRTFEEMNAILEKAEVDIESICAKVPSPTEGWNALKAAEVLT